RRAISEIARLPDGYGVGRILTDEGVRVGGLDTRESVLRGGVADHLRERPIPVRARESRVGLLTRRERRAVSIDDRAARAAARRGDETRVERIVCELVRSENRPVRRADRGHEEREREREGERPDVRRDR